MFNYRNSCAKHQIDWRIVKLSQWERELRDECGETIETAPGASFYCVSQQNLAQQSDVRIFNALERLTS